MNNNDLRIAIDGGAATGKSTVAKLVASKLGVRYINTGQMYRLFAFIALQNDVVTDEEAIYNLIKDIKVTYNEQGNITTDAIEFTIEGLEDPRVGEAASTTSSMPKVRAIGTKLQKEIALEKGVLLEGRDIGTVIMTDADFKFFLEVQPEQAAKRRYLQVVSNGDNDTTEAEILNFIVERNERDQNRSVAPLVAAEGAVTIDTSFDSAEAITDKILEVING